MRKSVLEVIALLVLFSACAAPGTQKRTEVLWPDPPQEPRIVFLQNYRGGMDFIELTFWDKIFGKTVVKDLQKPYGVYARDGRIYTTDTALGYVLLIDTNARTSAAIGDTGKGKLRMPLGIGGTPDGTLYVADGNLKTVKVYDGNGQYIRSIGGAGEFESPAGLAVDSALGRLYIADSRAHMVRVYSTNGELLFAFGERGQKDGQFNFPTNVAVDNRNNNVLVTDTTGFRVQIFDKDGKYLSKFGEAGDVPGTFARPKGIGVDSEGNIYVVDAGFNNVQIFNEQGIVRLAVGGPGRGPGEFHLPAGMHMDERDRFYVVDSLNARIAEFQFLSERWKREKPEEYQKYILPAKQEKPETPKQ